MSASAPIASDVAARHCQCASVASSHYVLITFHLKAGRTGCVTLDGSRVKVKRTLGKQSKLGQSSESTRIQLEQSTFQMDPNTE